MSIQILYPIAFMFILIAGFFFTMKKTFLLTVILTFSPITLELLLSLFGKEISPFPFMASLCLFATASLIFPCFDLFSRQQIASLQNVVSTHFEEEEKYKHFVKEEASIQSENQHLFHSVEEIESFYVGMKEMNTTLEFRKMLEIFFTILSDLSGFQEAILSIFPIRRKEVKREGVIFHVENTPVGPTQMREIQGSVPDRWKPLLKEMRSMRAAAYIEKRISGRARRQYRP